MKTKLIIFLIIFTIISCSTDSNSDGNLNNPQGENTTVIFENSSFIGTCLVKYTDNTQYEGNFVNGKMDIPNSGTGKTIASIQPQNQQFILIGRKEGGSIKLNYNNGVLLLRASTQGYIPIGTFAEFKLIGSDSTTLAADYLLEADLDFMNILWTPIAAFETGNFFEGNFEGQGHEINNIKIVSTSSQTVGLFGQIYNPSEGHFIANLTIKSGSIIGTSVDGPNVGSIAGMATNYDIINCKNYASVESKNYYAGGIIGNTGYLGGSIIECENFGFVKGKDIGGITAIGNTIMDCKNYGDLQIYITDNGQGHGGGIVKGAATIIGCSNSGIIKSEDGYGEWIGGIAAHMGPNGAIANCYNSGSITFTRNQIPSNNILFYAGGIVGYNGGGSVYASYNTSSLQSNCTIGGITGKNEGGYIGHCYNTGNLLSTFSGGITGIATSNPNQNTIVVNCYNTGQFLSNNSTYSGGIIGSIIQSGVAGNVAINDCFWYDDPMDNTSFGTGNILSNNINIIQTNIDAGVLKFSSQNWPSAAQNWLIGTGTSNDYWKSLGSWNNGNPIYPKLYYEN